MSKIPLEEESLYDTFSEEIPSTDPPPQNVADIQARISAINKLEAVDKQLLVDQLQMEEFYKSRREGITKRIDYIKGEIAGYMHYHNRTSLPTPKGTAYFRTSPGRQWLRNGQDLCDWLRENNLQSYIKVRYDPDKAGLLSAGVALPETIMQEHPHEELYVKKPG